MRRCILTFVLLAAALGTPNLASGQKQADAEKLQGTWAIVSIESKEGKLQYSEVEMFYTFTKDGKFLVKVKGKDGPARAFTTDAEKSPKQLVMAAADGKFAMRAIYKFEGDTLILGSNTNGGFATFPKSFDLKDANVIILKRQKP